MSGIEFKKFIQKAVSLLFPERCAFCGNVTVGSDLACGHCVKELPLIKGEKCENCGRGREFCRCKNKSYEFERCTAPFYYEGVAKRGILRLKYRKKSRSARVFAAFAADAVRREYSEIAFDLAVAVPMSKKEFHKRGFNQSEEFVRALSSELKIEYKQVLSKPFETQPQHNLIEKVRWGNVFGAFLADGDLSGKSVLLADDIITTGATLSECAKMLKLSGARSVSCVVMACVK